MAKTTVPPELHFAVGCWSAAIGARPHSMNISAARMLGPNAGFAFQKRGLKGVVLLDAQITHRIAGLMQSADELGPVVEESLAPLGMTGPHGQDSSLQR